MTMSFITCGFTDDFLKYIGAPDCDSYAHVHELLWIQKYNEISEDEFFETNTDDILSKEEISYFVRLRMINWIKLRGIKEAKEIEKYFKYKDVSPFSERQIRNEERFLEAFKKSIDEN